MTGASLCHMYKLQEHHNQLRFYYLGVFIKNIRNNYMNMLNERILIMNTSVLKGQS